MRTRTRFLLLFAALDIAVMSVGLGAIYRAVALDSARRIPIEAERVLADGAAVSIDESLDPGLRLEKASEALLGARALLARNRIMLSDPVIGLALQVAAILAVVLFAAALVFGLLARIFTKGIDELAAGVARAGADRTWRFPASGDVEFGKVRAALNELLDLSADQERRLAAGARLEGWREVASFLAHQIKNPLAALGLAAENGRLALERREGGATGAEVGKTSEAIVGDSFEIVRKETIRLTALINRFRDLAPAGLEAYSGGSRLDLRSLIEGCAERARASGAEVLVLGPELAVVADRALLEQALWNLFANSVEAAAGGPVSIRAELGVEGKQVVIVVSDSNRGLDPAFVERLGRERLSTKREGTGLGLVLVRRIAALQGGALDLSVGPAGGLVAALRMPLERSPA